MALFNQNPVPDKPEEKEKQEYRDKSNEPTFVIHAFVLLRVVRRCRSQFLQTGDVAIADEDRMNVSGEITFRLVQIKIEHADPVAGLALIDPAIARADHDSISRFLLPADVNHGVGDRRGSPDRKEIG